MGVWGRVGLDEATFSCTILKDSHGRSPKKMFFLVGFLFPCIVIILSYSCIYWTVRRQKKRLRAHTKASVTSRTSTAKKEREDSRLTAMMLTIFCCFLLCFLPLMTTNVFDSDVKVPTLHVIASIMCWASGVINPFIYAASNRTYRIAYLKLFNKLKFWGKPMILSSTASPGASQNGQLSQNTYNNNRIHVGVEKSKDQNGNLN